jgi:hypothetical protein
MIFREPSGKQSEAKVGRHLACGVRIFSIRDAVADDRRGLPGAAARFAFA